MKVKELIEKLQALPDEAKELEVYSYTDHGQTPECTGNPRIAYCEESEYSLDNFTTDEDEASEYGYEVKVVVLY